MATFLELDNSQKDRYGQFVAREAAGSFLQSWEWGEWQQFLGRRAFRYFLKEDDGRLLAAMQLISMPLGFGRSYLYCPYGPSPAPGFSFTSSYLEAFLRELKIKNPQAVFLRLEPQQGGGDLAKLAVKTANIQPGVTMMVDICKTEEETLSAMHPKTRYNIKLAQRHGVRVESELAVTPQRGLYVQEAVDLIIKTQDRQGYRGHHREYYRKLIDFFALHNPDSGLRLNIYKALYGKLLLAVGIMVDFGGTRTYLYGGSSAEHKNVMAPYLLHWQAMQDARRIGLLRYDLGGSEVASGGERGFTRFKKGFGGSEIRFEGAYDLVLNYFLYPIYAAARQLNRLARKVKTPNISKSQA